MSPTTDHSRGIASLQDVDVLIVGAGSSGIGAARRLRQRTPCSSYAIVDTGTSMDGVWNPLQYPPSRCTDSEMPAPRRALRPWAGAGSIGGGWESPARIPDKVSESGACEHIAHGIHVLRARWSGDPAHWVVTLQDRESGALATMSCSFLYLCSSHHGYAAGHTAGWRALIREYGVTRAPKGSAESGPRFRSGRTLEADMSLTSTGFNLRNVDGIELTVDGTPVDVPQYFLYRGMMLDGVPNLAFALSSSDMPWKLTADLVSEHVARLVAHMEEHGYTAVIPRLPSRPTETSRVPDIVSCDFDGPGEALPFFCGQVAAQELEFTPADVWTDSR